MFEFENVKIHSDFRRASLVVSLIFTHVRVSAEWLLNSLRPSVRPSFRRHTCDIESKESELYEVWYWRVLAKTAEPFHLWLKSERRNVTYARYRKSCTTAHSSSERRRRRRHKKLLTAPNRHVTPKAKVRVLNLVCSVL